RRYARTESGRLIHADRHLPLAVLFDEREFLLVAVVFRVVDDGLVALDGRLVELAAWDLVVFAQEAFGLEVHLARYGGDLDGTEAERLLQRGLLGRLGLAVARLERGGGLVGVGLRPGVQQRPDLLRV